jgi:hypothetical protein
MAFLSLNRDYAKLHFPGIFLDRLMKITKELSLLYMIHTQQFLDTRYATTLVKILFLRQREFKNIYGSYFDM